MRGEPEKATFVRLKEQKLVKVGIRDTLNWFNVIAVNELVVCVGKLDASLP